MDCNCIDMQREALREQFAEAEVTNGYSSIDLVTGKTKECFEPLRFRYHPKKSDGTLSKAWEKSFVIFNYCPMCGVKKRQ